MALAVHFAADREEGADRVVPDPDASAGRDVSGRQWHMSTTTSTCIMRSGPNFDCEGCTDAPHTPLFFALYFGMTGLTRHAHDRWRGNYPGPDLAGQERAYGPAWYTPVEMFRSLLALCRYCLDIPVPLLYLIDRARFRGKEFIWPLIVNPT